MPLCDRPNTTRHGKRPQLQPEQRARPRHAQRRYRYGQHATQARHVQQWHGQSKLQRHGQSKHVQRHGQYEHGQYEHGRRQYEPTFIIKQNLSSHCSLNLSLKGLNELDVDTFLFIVFRCTPATPFVEQTKGIQNKQENGPGNRTQTGR